MAAFAFVDGVCKINTVDLSDHAKSIKLTYGAKALSNTAMGMTTESNMGGLKTWQLQITFEQDFAANKVDATIFPLVGTTTTFEVRPTSAGATSTNPALTGTCYVSSYEPLSGSVGDLALSQVTLMSAGTLAHT